MAEPSRVSGQAVEVLGVRGTVAEGRVSGQAVEVLGERVPNFTRISALAIEVLSSRHPCPVTPTPPWIIEHVEKGTLHRFARLYEITLTDTTVFRTTDHNAALDFGGNAYTPVGGFLPFAAESQAQFEESTTEVSGPLAASLVDDADLETKRWHDAKVVEYVVDWRYPWMGQLRKRVFWVQDVSWDGTAYKFKLAGSTSRISRKRNEVYARTCPHDLGDAYGTTDRGCKYDVASNTKSGTVSDVISATREFNTTTAAVTAEASGHFEYGYVTWTSGANSGTTQLCRKHSTIGSKATIQLQLAAYYGIEAGDAFDITPGCNKTLTTCKDKFSQVINFGGFPFLPSSDGLRFSINEGG